LLGTTARSQGFSFDNKSDSSVHAVRINILVGVSQGVSEMELGGLINVDRKNVQYLQMAGFGNIVGGDVKGCQLAGFFNTDMGAMNGIQGAGFGNYTGKDFSGLQGAGFFNHCANMKGIQGAGFSNYARDMNGIQAAGFGNYAKSIYGIQASGFVNVVDSSTKGIQAAGFINYSKTVDGIQAAGFINCAKTVVKGLQVAPFNVADSSNGIPIGVISYVRKGGYHKIEISADEMFYANVAIRTGVKQLYNILTVGIRPTNAANPFWTYGYGLGTAFTVSKRIDMNIDVTSNHISYAGYRPHNYNSDDYKIYVGADFHISDKLSIAAGPTLNFYSISRYNTDLVNAFNGIPLIYLYDQTNGSFRDLKVWVGGKIAVRFF